MHYRTQVVWRLQEPRGLASMNFVCEVEILASPSDLAMQSILLYVKLLIAFYLEVSRAHARSQHPEP